ncbi:MAG TPA: DUF3040 domain-containing protein [Streptosporangiaceae bacterium]|nr:DUF3040 domain-containing protein [Streptosporangiaceae bacterium]
MLSAHDKNVLAEIEQNLRARAFWLRLKMTVGNVLLGRSRVLRDRLVIAAVLLAALALGAILATA